MRKHSWKFHPKMLTGFRNTKLWSGKWLFNAIFLMKLCFLNHFWLWSFVFLKSVNTFKWHFQECFPIEVPWKWSYFGWAWQLFNTCHAHFPQTLLFQKCPKNLTNFRKFKFFLHFLLQFCRAFQWCIVCFHTFSGLGFTDQNVYQEIGEYTIIWALLYLLWLLW